MVKLPLLFSGLLCRLGITGCFPTETCLWKTVERVLRSISSKAPIIWKTIDWEGGAALHRPKHCIIQSVCANARHAACSAVSCRGLSESTKLPKLPASLLGAMGKRFLRLWEDWENQLWPTSHCSRVGVRPTTAIGRCLHHADTHCQLTTRISSRSIGQCISEPHHS